MKNGVSIIISARNEYPQIAMTVDNLMMDLYSSELHDWEIIIADNGSTDMTTSFWKYAFNNPYAKTAKHQLREEMKKSPRGMVNEGRLRFTYDPVFSNVGARDKAVKYARYPNIIFADAHISVKPGTIKYMLETLDEYGGVVHAPVAWMGASVYRPHPGMQYSYKIGEKIWGTWNYAQTESDKPFFIPLSGHCFIAVKKSQYEDFGGYDTNQRIYGGGENYLDTLYWLLGSNVMCDPRALVFHLSSGRGYSYDVHSLIHNMLLTAYTLGGHKWSERLLITYLEKNDKPSEYYYAMYEEAVREGEPKRKMIAERQIMSLEDLLGINKPHDCDGKEYKMQSHTKRKWDILNDEKYGHHISFVAVFDEWLERLQNPEAIEFYKNSPYQK